VLRACLLLELIVGLPACSSGSPSGNCDVPYVPGQTLEVPYAPTCDGGEVGCDLICQDTCPRAPNADLYLQECMPRVGEGGVDGGGGIVVSCVYAPYPTDPVCD